MLGAIRLVREAYDANTNGVAVEVSGLIVLAILIWATVRARTPRDVSVVVGASAGITVLGLWPTLMTPRSDFLELEMAFFVIVDCTSLLPLRTALVWLGILGVNLFLLGLAGDRGWIYPWQQRYWFELRIALCTTVVFIAMVGMLVRQQGLRRIRQLRVEVERQRQTARALDAIVHQDMLTGLPNRRALFVSLQAASERYHKDGHGFAVAFVDLDRFKPVNDTYGHEVGDQLLIEVAARLKQVLREGDLVARVGGDEFVFLFANPQSRDGVEQLLDALKAGFDQPFVVGPHSLSLGLSVGSCRCPDDGNDPDTLLRVSDSRMYRTKARQRNRSSSES